MKSVDGVPKPRREREQSVTTRHLASFLALTFAFSWGWWGLWKALQMPVGFFLVGTAGPTIAAFVVLAATSGKAGVVRLLKSYLVWRVGLRWYLVTLLGIPALLILSYAVVPGALAGFVDPDWSFIPTYAHSLVIILLIPPSGPLLEEGGWRGFALGPLQNAAGPLNGSLALGVLWALWHAPFYFGPMALTGPQATLLDTSITFFEYMVGIVGLTVVMSWILNNTGRSVLMAVLLHLGFDAAWTFAGIFPTVSTDIVPVSLSMGIALVFGTTAVVVAIATRGKLGYPGNLDQALETQGPGR